MIAIIKNNDILNDIVNVFLDVFMFFFDNILFVDLV